MDLLEQIKKNHGNAYPRPTIPCECGYERTICWGPTKNPYLSHKSGGCNKKSFGESEAHQLGKKLLTEFLNNKNNKVNFVKKCDCCEFIIFSGSLVYKEEKNHQLNGEICRYDIGVFNKEVIIGGIEIYHSHRAKNSDVRNDLLWVEINSREIIKKIGRNMKKREITLTDIYCPNDKNDEDEEIDNKTNKKCHGSCLRQLDYENCFSSYKLDPECSEKCVPVKCPSCCAYLPEEILLCNGGMCLNCAITNFHCRGSTIKKPIDNIKRCETCGGPNKNNEDWKKECIGCYRISLKMRKDNNVHFRQCIKCKEYNINFYEPQYKKYCNDCYY